MVALPHLPQSDQMLLGLRAPLAVANGHTQQVAAVTAKTARKKLLFHCFIAGDMCTHTSTASNRAAIYTHCENATEIETERFLRIQYSKHY